MFKMLEKLNNEWQKNWDRYIKTNDAKYLDKCLKITEKKLEILKK